MRHCYAVVYSRITSFLCNTYQHISISYTRIMSLSIVSRCVRDKQMKAQLFLLSTCRSKRLDHKHIWNISFDNECGKCSSNILFCQRHISHFVLWFSALICAEYDIKENAEYMRSIPWPLYGLFEQRNTQYSSAYFR